MPIWWRRWSKVLVVSGLARAAPAEVLEGSWQGRRTAIFEFPDMTTHDKFYYSDEYKPLVEMRQKSADVTIIKIEGVK